MGMVKVHTSGHAVVQNPSHARSVSMPTASSSTDVGQAGVSANFEWPRLHALGRRNALSLLMAVDATTLASAGRLICLSGPYYFQDVRNARSPSI